MTRLVLLWLFALGCGAQSHDAAPSSLEGERRGGVVGSVDEADEGPAEEGDAPEADEAGPRAPLPCAARDTNTCAAGDGCVLERSGACREAANECEAIRLDHRGRTPAFGDGDPCQRANPACAWSVATGRCAPFVAVPECPATIEEASELAVFCDHSSQPTLDCQYRGTQCACRRAPYCGGVAPPPEVAAPPGRFSCVPDFDARGCPTRRVPEGSRCRLAPDVQCQVGCYGLYTCERGRWRRRQLPPRP